MYAMVSPLFQLILFSHQGRIFKVDQLAFCTADPNSTGNVPFVGKPTSSYKNLGFGFLKDSLLMGTFTLPPPNTPFIVSQVNMISSSTPKSYDPWILPTQSELITYNDEMPLSPWN